MTVHKARPQDESLGVSACAVCGSPVKRVPGGQGPTWIHTETGTVAGRGADPAMPRIVHDDGRECTEQAGQWFYRVGAEGFPGKPFVERCDRDHAR
jgi:hypothetical protein